MEFWYDEKKGMLEEIIYGKDGLQYIKRKLLLSRVMKILGVMGIAFDSSFVIEAFNELMTNFENVQLKENWIPLFVILIATMIYAKGQKIFDNTLLDLEDSNIRKRYFEDTSGWGVY